MRSGFISHSAMRASDSSPTLVQQRQPLVTSLTEMRASAATAESTAASPYSFFSHAQLYPGGSAPIRDLIIVVLPAPR
eukprot:scaffold4312_cov30-Phaeocystis_antarctica.AAC.2